MIVPAASGKLSQVFSTKVAKYGSHFGSPAETDWLERKCDFSRVGRIFRRSGVRKTSPVAQT